MYFGTNKIKNFNFEAGLWKKFNIFAINKRQNSICFIKTLVAVSTLGIVLSDSAIAL